ncbi:MAG: sigma factor-like helix-turn-helix DNA-binding protein [Gemmataceae bacterium]
MAHPRAIRLPRPSEVLAAFARFVKDGATAAERGEAFQSVALAVGWPRLAARLARRERAVLEARYGTRVGAVMPVQTVALVVGLSTAAVRRLEGRAIYRLARRRVGVRRRSGCDAVTVARGLTGRATAGCGIAF